MVIGNNRVISYSKYILSKLNSSVIISNAMRLSLCRAGIDFNYPYSKKASITLIQYSASLCAYFPTTAKHPPYGIMASLSSLSPQSHLLPLYFHFLPFLFMLFIFAFLIFCLFIFCQKDQYVFLFLYFIFHYINFIFIRSLAFYFQNISILLFI